MSETVIKSESLSSAFFAGFGKEDENIFGEVVGKLWEGIVNVAKSALEKIEGAFTKAKETFLKAKGFFTDWFRDDPVGALAGGAAVVGIGIVIVAVGVAVAPTAAAIAGTAFAAGKLLIGGLIGLAKIYWAMTGVTGLLALIGITTVGLLFNAVVQATSFLWNFNWNVSDGELDRQSKAQIEQLAGLTGGALGQILGNTVCGGVAGAIATKLNPVMAVHIKKELGEEIYEESISAIWSVASTTQRIIRGWIFREAFKQIRRFVKFVSSKLPNGGPGFIKRWGESDSQPWVFSAKFEEAVESIPNKYVQQFVEEFFDEFFDACGDIILTAGDVASFRYP